MPAGRYVHFSQDFKQRCLAHLRQADDSSFHFFVASLQTANVTRVCKLCSAPVAVGSARGRPRPYLFCVALRSKPLDGNAFTNFLVRLLQRARRVVGLALI
jgi:hypothetical protein